MRSLLLASVWCLSMASDVPPFLVGSYSYVFNNDLYALQLSVHANSTADFDFIINNDCESDVEYPRHWAMHGLKVQYNDTESELVFLESLDGYESIIDDLTKSFEKVGPLITPIRVKVADDGSSIQANIIKVNCLIPKVSTPLDMESLHENFIQAKSPTVDTVIAGDTGSANSAVCSSVWGAMLIAPLATGMMDWLGFH